MEENGVRCGEAHQLLVYLIGGELSLAFLGLGLLAHAGPHVCIDDPCAGHCFVWILCEGWGDAKLRGELYDPGTRGMTFGMGDSKHGTGEGTAKSEGVGYVIAVADVGYFHPF